MKCPKCKTHMKKVKYDLGFEIFVESYTCPDCMFNITDEKKLNEAVHKLKELVPSKFSI